MEIKMLGESVWCKLTGEARELSIYKNWIDHNVTGCTQWVDNDVYALLGALLELKAIEGASKLSRGEQETVMEAVDALTGEGLLRNYQAEMTSSALLAPLGRSILKAPPGAGKTRVCAAICLLGALIGMPKWHYVVKNNELASQAYIEMTDSVETMRTALEDAGYDFEDCSISASTFSRIPGDVFDGLLVDECHTLAARTRAIPYSAASAFYRIGLSGTPLDRSTGNSLVTGLLGPVLYEVKRQTLVEENCLARSNVNRVLINKMGGYKIQELA